MRYDLPATRRFAPPVFVIAILVVSVSVFLVLRHARRGLAPEVLRERMVSVIQREARQSVLLTGSIDVTATVTIENAKTLLPGLIGLNLGTSRATVQVPGRAHYGFHVSTLDEQRIRISGDTIEMTVPPPALISIDANLQELRIWSDQGWLRSPRSVQTVERAAIQRVDDALARQAAAYIATSAQPRVNTAKTLQEIMTRALTAAGITNPVFRFQVGDRLILQ